MKRLFFLLLIVVGLVGCQTTKEIKIDEHIKLSFFYVSTCKECQAFKKKAIPLLNNTFKDQIEIHQYDLDEDSTKEIYDNYIDSLDEFDEEFYGNGPFYVIDNYFAVLGYTVGDEDYLIDDIKNAITGKELSDELEGLRFYFKDSK